MRGMLKVRLPTAILVVLLIVTFYAVLVKFPEEVSAYTPHSTIYINGDGEFTPANGVTGGSGTPSDPYIIEGWEIDASAFTGILILSTTAHFLIRDSWVSNGSFSIPGICLNGVSNGVIESVVIANNNQGIYLIRSSNITMANNSIWNNYYGIYLDRSSNNTVENNSALDNLEGIHLYQSNDNTIFNNMITSNNNNGIYLEECNNATIANNTATDSVLGIVFRFATNITLANNSMIATGIAIFGWTLEQWNSHSIDTSNTVNGKPVYYWKDKIGGTVPPGAGEIILVNCTNAIIENQNLSNGSIGIIVAFSSYTAVANTSTSSHKEAAEGIAHGSGISISFSNRTSVVNSTLSNERCGISIYYSTGTEIIRTTIAQSREHGLWVRFSGGTIVRDSTIIGTQRFESVELFDTPDTVFLNTNISLNADDAGILAGKSPNLLVENCTISNNYVGINFWYYTSNATVINSTVTDNSYVDFHVGPHSNATVLNTTFNKTRVRFWEDIISNLTVKWYAHVKVIDINNKPVAGADVEVRDLNDDSVFSGATSPEGYARWIVANEYYQNDTNSDGDGEDPGEKIFYTPHNITVSRDGCVVYADPEPYMNQSREIVVKLQCAYATYIVTKSPVQGNVTIDGVEYLAPAILGLLQGSTHTISVNSPENQGPDARFIFDYWDDGGAQIHDITVGITDTVITAFYRTQYRPTITLIGLDPMHTVTVYHTKDGLPENDPGISNSWSDWCDNGTPLSLDVDAVGSIGTERWHTYADFSVAPWVSVTSPFVETVVYYHQYKPIIALIGTDTTHSVSAHHFEGGGSGDDPGIFNSWSDWCDEGTSLSFDADTSGSTATERWHTYRDFQIGPWSSVPSAFARSVVYHHQYKPAITLSGTDVVHNVNAYHTEGSLGYTDIGIFDSWNDWCDEGTSLSFDADTSGSTATERWYTYADFSAPPWSNVTSAFTETVTYYHQFKVTVATNGLIPSYPAAITVVQGSASMNPTTYSSWSDWADADSGLSIIEVIAVSGTERFSTIDTTSWIVSSASTWTVDYYHQYKSTITAIGLVSTHPATVTLVQYGSTSNPTTHATWFDWADDSTTLSIVDTVVVSDTERYSTIDITSWIVSSGVVSTVEYNHQFKVDLTINGLISSYPATVAVVQRGNSFNLTTYANWSDWADADSTLSVNDSVIISARERYHTVETVLWTVDSALSLTVNYTHQFMPAVTLIGTDSTHTVSVTHTLDGQLLDDSGVFANWSEWADDGFQLTFSEYTSHEPRRYTTDIRAWSVDSPFDATITYVEAPDEGEGEEQNFKPMIALIFCVILAITGVMIAYRRPLRLSRRDQMARNRLYTGILIVLPFVVAEALTGLISLLIGVLSVPPLLGLGMVVDSGILAVGLIAQFWSLRKAKTYEQD